MLAKLKKTKRKSDGQTQKTALQQCIRKKTYLKNLGPLGKSCCGSIALNDKTRTKSVSVEGSI